MKSLDLVYPPNGTITDPLQLFTWPVQEHDLLEPDYDRSLPRPVKLAWKKPSLNGQPLRYELKVSLDPNFQEATGFSNLHEPSAEIWNLYLGKRYFWKVIAWDGKRQVAESPAWSFFTNQAGPRWIRVPAITNVRDIGGWPLKAGGRIRQGLLYRSSEMNSHLVLSAEGERVLLEDLKIRTDIDLRGSEEIREPALDEWRVRWVNIPLQPYDNIALPQYQELYRYAFQLLSNSNTYPAIVHCWGGADRTGTLFFLLEAALGMDEDCLLQDYELTSLSVWGKRSVNSQEFGRLLGALKHFSRPGGSLQEQAEGYLGEIGVTQKEMASIRSILVDK